MKSDMQKELTGLLGLTVAAMLVKELSLRPGIMIFPRETTEDELKEINSFET
jgi:hypothetical protein